MPQAALIPLVIGVVGAIGQTISQVQASRGQAAAADAEAESIREQAAFEERESRQRSRRVIAKGRAIGAASGVDIGSGSPLLLELDSAREAELEAQAIKAGGANRIAGKRFESRLARGRIPGQIFGGFAKGGTILSQFLNRR